MRAHIVVVCYACFVAVAHRSLTFPRFKTYNTIGNNNISSAVTAVSKPMTVLWLLSNNHGLGYDYLSPWNLITNII